MCSVGSIQLVDYSIMPAGLPGVAVRTLRDSPYTALNYFRLVLGHFQHLNARSAVLYFWSSSVQYTKQKNIFENLKKPAAYETSGRYAKQRQVNLCNNYSMLIIIVEQYILMIVHIRIVQHNFINIISIYMLHCQDYEKY